jgi:imidazoleglycerol-phosphate dehydratase
LSLGGTGGGSNAPRRRLSILVQARRRVRIRAPRGPARAGATMRRAKVSRKTTETQIELQLALDGTGQRKIDTPVPFFNHMLEAVARHGLYDLEVAAKGDVEVDPHHLVEDVGIVLGQAFRDALGDKAGITRYGHALIPMDETLVQAAVDFSGRAAFVYLADQIKGKTIGTFDAELAREFFGGFAASALVNLHLEIRYGENAHHMVEALFKAFARATSMAVRPDPRVVGVPSTKGTLTG